jgi:hypothetical protein
VSVGLERLVLSYAPFIRRRTSVLEPIDQIFWELETIGVCNAQINHYLVKEEMNLVMLFMVIPYTKTYTVTAAYRE